MFSPDSNASEAGLLKTLLQPLLEDFHYWFARSQALLEQHSIDFLGEEAQAHLLNRIRQAQQELSVAQTLFRATDGQVGIETAVLIPWHQLVTECWQVSIKFRMEHPEISSFEPFDR
jgi:Protein of unknown function (DUF2605)